MKKTETDQHPDAFLRIQRPHIALITNHGYGGAEIPIGGAPDTGGQNVYVNSYAKALDRLGYKVTIYARGGFPFFESDRIRAGEEMLTPNVRYVFVPGGGDEFIRKEDISVALIEEKEWVYDHIEKEASQLNLFPWQYYDLINTHYWDAAVIAISLVVRWQNDICSRMIELLLNNVVSKEKINGFQEEAHIHFISKAPDFYLGKLLLEDTGDKSYVYREEVLLKAFKHWTQKSELITAMPENIDKHIDWLNLRSTIAAENIQLKPLILAKVLGTAMLEQPINEAIFEDNAFRRFRSYDHLETYNQLLSYVLDYINKHAWTPHSLGVIKERNFKDKPLEVKRKLKFRERRSHERVICDYTSAFGATSYEIAESLVTDYGVPIDDVLFFPPGVDTDVFHKYPKKEMRDLYDYLKEETGLDKEIIKSGTILFETSRMDHTKRKDVLVKSFLKVLKDHDENMLLFIGGGPENEIFKSLQKILSEHPESKEKIFLLGFIPDDFLPMMFSLCDIYVSASEMEGFGMSVAQAAMIGKPVVSSDTIPFTRFYLQEDAIIVPAGDIDGFAKGIYHLVRDKEQRKSMGSAIRKKAQGLEWENLTKNFIIDLNKKNFDIPITENISQMLR